MYDIYHLQNKICPDVIDLEVFIIYEYLFYTPNTNEHYKQKSTVKSIKQSKCSFVQSVLLRLRSFQLLSSNTLYDNTLSQENLSILL